MIDAAGIVAEAVLSEHLTLGELAAMKLGYVLGAGHQASVCVCVGVCVCARAHAYLLGRQGSGGEGWSVVSNEKCSISIP